MERRILFDAFERVFESRLSNEKSRYETFVEASEEYQKNFGFTPYKDHDSFMSSRSRYRKKKR